MKIPPVPAGFHTVTPYLMVDNAAAFLAFIEKALGATITERVLGPGGRVSHAQAQIGDSMIMLGEANANWKAEPASLYLYLENVDAAYQRAVDAGATSLMAPMDMFYGDRMSGVQDGWGITWWIATHIEDVPPAELQKRADEAWKKRATT